MNGCAAASAGLSGKTEKKAFRGCPKTPDNTGVFDIIGVINLRFPL
jgi:hypothetical protein